MKKSFDDTRPFCINCGRHVGYRVEAKPASFEMRDKTIQYDEVIAVCARCSQELYVPYINDLNCDSVEEAYRKK